MQEHWDEDSVNVHSLPVSSLHLKLPGNSVIFMVNCGLIILQDLVDSATVATFANGPFNLIIEKQILGEKHDGVI